MISLHDARTLSIERVADLDTISFLGLNKSDAVGLVETLSF
jgi:hypothetical protein